MTIKYSIASSIVKKHINHFSITSSKDIILSINQKRLKDFSINDNVITFNANNVFTLQEYLNNNNHNIEYTSTLALLSDIGFQILYLENNNLGIPFFNLEDIIVITYRDNDSMKNIGQPILEETNLDDESFDPVFIFLNNDKIFKINENNLIFVDTPISFQKYSFLSPELDSIDHSKLPFYVNFRSCYFSSALLIIYVLLDKHFKSNTPSITDGNIINNNLISILDPIQYTNLYYFLLRCLEFDPDKRKFIFI